MASGVPFAPLDIEADLTDWSFADGENATAAAAAAGGGASIRKPMKQDCASAGDVCKEGSKPCCGLLNKDGKAVICKKIDASISRCCYVSGYLCGSNQECCESECEERISGYRFCL